MEPTGRYQDQCKYVEFGANLPNNKFTRNHITTKDQVNTFRFKYHNTGVYTTIYSYDNKDQNEANLWAPFYLDFDKDQLSIEEDAFEEVRDDTLLAIRYLNAILNIPIEYISIYYSGQKGIHLIVNPLVFMIEPCKELNAMYKLLAEDINAIAKANTIDIGLYDNKRMFRLPHSIHQTTGLYKIPLTYDELKSLSISEIKELAKRPRHIETTQPELCPQARSIMTSYKHKIQLQRKNVKKVKYDKKLDITPPCIQYILSETVPAGQRNNTSIALASFFRQRGYDDETAEGMLFSWSEDYCSPPLSERELEDVLKKVYAKEYKYGCNKLKELAPCELHKCKLGGRTNG